jgi:hypothetical protein
VVQIAAIFPDRKQLAELRFYQEFKTDTLCLDVADRNFFVYTTHFPGMVREIYATILDECDRS